MVRWSRRHGLWILAGAAGSLLALLGDLWWHEWRETGRAYKGDGIRPLMVRWSGDPPVRVRCIP